MAQPTAYQPAHEFWNDEGINPNFPGSELDIEFGALDITLTQILANLALIQRDDGELANQSVGLDQLTTAVRAMIGDQEAIETIEALVDDIDASVAAAAASAAAASSTVTSAITGLIGGASSGFDTLGEIETALAAKAPLASPTFTGTPAAPTAAANTNTTQIATTAYVQGELTDLLAGVSSAFDTLSEIATELALKAPATSGTAILKGNGTGGFSSAAAGTDYVVPTAIREKLSAARNYYVRTDGSDSNDGLTDSSGGAFLTVGKALSVAYNNLDLNGNNVTINIGAGTYSAALSITSPQVGAGQIRLVGDATTPTNVEIAGGSSPALTVTNRAAVFFSGLYFTSSGAALISVSSGASVQTRGKNAYGGGASHRIYVEGPSQANMLHEEVISGTVAGGHYWAANGGFVYCQGATWTASGTATQSTAFAVATNGGKIYAFGNSKSGTFTGPRYYAELNGVINTNGGGTSYFPGDAAGSLVTGGKYDALSDNANMRAWAYATMSAGAPTLQKSFNITSVTDEAAGLITFTIATDFDSANWAAQATPADTSTTIARSATISSQAAGSVQFTSVVEAGSGSDPTAWSFIGAGVQ